MVKYLAWTPRHDGQPVNEAHDRAVRLSAAEQGFPDIPSAKVGWARGRADLGGQISISSERFTGSTPVWIWEV